mmetsp:Transcript_7709/g.32771  ORF Transcript_7709/g.32771 Transcript_7709/m.32771 type:complete len:204 (+) Transcript_7709:250-861(+)
MDQIVLICMYANVSPMHPWRPPPNPMNEPNAALSSGLGSLKRSGLYSCASLKTPSMRCANAGEVATMCPFGTTNSFPFVVVTLKGTWHCRSSMISGGCMRNASLMAKCSSSISASTSKSMVSPCLLLIFNCSASSVGITFALFAMDSRPVHVLVMEEVCWPAKRTAMSMPSTWSLVKRLPSLYRASMNVWSTSGSDAPDSRRA